MNLKQINELTLDDCFTVILRRLIDFSEVEIPEGELAYYIMDDETGELSMFDRLAINAAIEKPLFANFEAEFEKYKAELVKIEEARLAEIARQEALNNRWKALGLIDQGHPWFYRKVQNIPNCHKHVTDLIKEKKKDAEVQELMSLMEETKTIILSENANKDKVKEDRINLIKNKQGSIKGRLEAIIEHMGI